MTQKLLNFKLTCYTPKVPGLGLYASSVSSRPAGELGAPQLRHPEHWKEAKVLAEGGRGGPPVPAALSPAPCRGQSAQAPEFFPSTLEPASWSSPTPQAQPVCALLWAAELCQPRGWLWSEIPASAQNSLHFCDGNMVITTPFSLFFYLPSPGIIVNS